MGDSRPQHAAVATAAAAAAAAAGPAAANPRLEPPGINPIVRQLLVQPPSKPTMGRVAVSPVLARLQQFLPEMAAANATLQQQVQAGADVVLEQPEGVDTDEEEDEGEEEEEEARQHSAACLQLDLLCGVYDLHDAAALRAAEAAMAEGPGIAVERFDPGSSSSSDSDSSEEQSDGELEGQDGSQPSSSRGGGQAGGAGPAGPTTGTGQGTAGASSGLGQATATPMEVEGAADVRTIARQRRRHNRKAAAAGLIQEM